MIPGPCALFFCTSRPGFLLVSVAEWEPLYTQLVCFTPGLALDGVLHTRLALSGVLHTQLALNGVYCSSSHTLPSSLLPVALGRMCCETQQMDHLLIKTVLNSLQIDGG